MRIFQLAFFGELSGTIAVNRSGFEKTVASVLATANEINAATGVSGIILHSSPFVAMVLEGSRRHVNEMFLEMALDARFARVTLVGAQSSNTKSLTRWGFVVAGADRIGSRFVPDSMSSSELTQLALRATDPAFGLELVGG